MQPRREMLAEYDYSVRVNLASNALCGGGVRTPSVTLKLHLQSTDESANHSSERQVMLELTPEQLAALLDDFARISKELARTS